MAIQFPEMKNIASDNAFDNKYDSISNNLKAKKMITNDLTVNKIEDTDLLALDLSLSNIELATQDKRSEPRNYRTFELRIKTYNTDLDTFETSNGIVKNYGTHAQLALVFDANDPDANLNMAKVLMATGKPEEGLAYVNKTMQLDPRNMADPLYEAGMAYFIMGDLREAATMIERAIKFNPTIFGHYESLSAIYALLDRNQDAQAAYKKALKAWAPNRIPAYLITLMSYFPVRDRQVADRYADGLLKAGFPGQPSEYHKIYEENRLTGQEIRNLVLGQEITVYENNQEFWIDHKENGRLVNVSWAREGKWWIDGDMLCYQMERGKLKGLNDCGEIYRNTDALSGSKKQHLHVKDYIIAALAIEE
jgi:tetratricopeptide (TPR) repeat protein